MNKGRNKATNKVISAANAAIERALNNPDFTDRHGFECPDCRVQLTCINFDIPVHAEESRGMTHAFSTRWSEEGNHKEDCRYLYSQPPVLWRLINRATYGHTTGLVTLYLPKPDFSKGGMSIAPTPPQGEVIRPRRARDSMLEMMWAEQSDMLHAIHQRPETVVVSPDGRYPACDFVTPAAKLNTALCGCGVIFGSARVIAYTSSKGVPYHQVTFRSPTPANQRISARLWPHDIEDPRNQKILENLEQKPYDVAIWWRSAGPPKVGPTEDRQGFQNLWLGDIGAVALKDYDPD